MVTYSWSFRVPRPHLELFFCCVRVCNLFTTAVALSLVSAASAPSPTKTIHRALTEGEAPATLGTNSAVPYCAVQKTQKETVLVLSSEPPRVLVGVLLLSATGMYHY